MKSGEKVQYGKKTKRWAKSRKVNYIKFLDTLQAAARAKRNMFFAR